MLKVERDDPTLAVLEGDVVECNFHGGQFNNRTGAVVGRRAWFRSRPIPRLSKTERYPSRCELNGRLKAVVPAKAGTHNHRLWNMGPRLRGDDSYEM